jgi:hypothetical protein
VFDGAAALGRTPLKLERSSGSSATLRFTLDGFQPQDLPLTWDTSHPVVVTMAAQRAAAPVKPRPAAPPRQSPLRANPFGAAPSRSPAR